MDRNLPVLFINNFLLNLTNIKNIIQKNNINFLANKRL